MIRILSNLKPKTEEDFQLPCISERVKKFKSVSSYFNEKYPNNLYVSAMGRYVDEDDRGWAYQATQEMIELQDTVFKDLEKFLSKYKNNISIEKNYATQDEFVITIVKDSHFNFDKKDLKR